MRSESPAVDVWRDGDFSLIPLVLLGLCRETGSFVLGTSLRAAVNLVITLLRLTRKK